MSIIQNYNHARELYAGYGVDTELALERLDKVPVSINCWQLDDLSGFEDPERGLSGGIAAFGSAPGKPKSRAEYMANLEKALSLVPGRNKLALHAIYPDEGREGRGRDRLEPGDFAGWVDFAKSHGIGLDFNPTYFSHPMADSGFTLASADPAVRGYWIEHGKRCRRIGQYFGRELGIPCVTNHWIPDGYKDVTADKLAPRLRLAEAYDEILAEPISPGENIDSVESKLFGLGSESFVIGSHEFYMLYAALRKNCIVCMDTGHFHPTEVVSSKLSAFLALGQEVMLHVSRPVRWDSDHVPILDDECRSLMYEIAAQDAFDSVHIGLDYFDASINRVAATVLGARSVKQALLCALLEPVDELKAAEAEGDFTRRLITLERSKLLPFGAVWEYYCETHNMPGYDWLREIEYAV